MTLVFKNKGCLYSNDQQQHRALLAQSVDRRRLRAVHDKNALAFRRLTLHALARAVSSGLLLRVFCGLCEDRRLRMQGTRLTSAGSSILRTALAQLAGGAVHAALGRWCIYPWRRYSCATRAAVGGFAHRQCTLEREVGSRHRLWRGCRGKTRVPRASTRAAAASNVTVPQGAVGGFAGKSTITCNTSWILFRVKPKIDSFRK